LAAAIMVERPKRCKRREAIIQQWIFALVEQAAKRLSRKQRQHC